MPEIVASAAPLTAETGEVAPAVVDAAALRIAQEVWTASPNGAYWDEFARRLPQERAAGSRPEPAAAAREL